MTDLLRRMLLIRHLESELQKLCDQGVAGDLHFNRGQEAIAVGVCAALRHTDHIVTHHRTLAHYVAKATARVDGMLLGGESLWSDLLYSLVCEVLNRRDGINKGRAGEMHINHPGIGYDFSFQLVGTCVPVAAGLAWALKNHRKTDEIVAVFCGDAATANGQFHEGMNIAAVQKVPLLVVIEDNGRAGNITSEYYRPNALALGRIGEAYGVHCAIVDGNNVKKIEAGAYNLRGLITGGLARYPAGPAILICNTERLCHHKQGQRDIRTPEELAKAAERDPLRDMAIPDDIKRLVDGVIARALDCPPAEPFIYPEYTNAR